MDKNMHNFSDRIKNLREMAGFTQADLAKKLNITRSSVNAWEMGLSVPSTPFVVELSHLFNVTTDFLLGVERNLTITTEGLTENEISVLINTVQCFHAIRQSCSTVIQNN